jgi:hypothetical protein
MLKNMPNGLTEQERKGKLKNTALLFSLLFLKFGFSQSQINSFLKPSDSLNSSRRNSVIIAQSALATSALVGLHQVWYADYPKSNFKLVNDNDQWNQMDKIGHIYASYHLGSFGAQTLNWSGCDKKSQLLYGATVGFAFLTTVEVFDGFSSKWGFSVGDVVANAGGTALYVSQELLWNEQRIVPKFSFHTTPYASARPNVLGSSLSEQILKDYNGQTYWFSANLHSFFKNSKIPKWLNLAVGYGAEGMITGKDELVNTVFFDEKNRTRQFYLSLDADLTKIKTKSHVLKTIFSVVSTIKIPAPTLEINSCGKVKGFGVYF